MKKSNLQISITIIFTILFFVVKSQDVKKIQKVYEEAGENRKELRKVIEHYTKYDKDSLKLEAAYFLIENMKGHAYSKAKLVDSTENNVDFDVLDYKDYKEMVNAWDEIETKVGDLHFKRDTIIYDSQVLTSEFLIHNIDLAFYAWEKPWAKKVSFSDFCEYILPYRGSNEPIENWRIHFIKEFINIEDSIQDVTDPIEVVNFINSSLKSWYKFDARMYRHPTDLGLKEMLDTKVGRCEDMTNLAIYAMRANGIPVMSDYVTHWPTSGNNHAWNSTFDKNGNTVIFMGGLQNVGEYKLNNKKAKVYRKTYSTNNASLTKIKPEYEKVPAWLKSTHNKDVSSEYFEGVDISVNLINEKPDSVNYAYLCVFNSGNWKATAWGTFDYTNKVNFKNIGTEIVYMASYYKNDSLIPVNYPFVLRQDGSLNYLIPTLEREKSFSFYSTTKRAIVKTTDEISKASFEKGKTFELYYWENEWIFLGKQKAKKNKPLRFKNIPENALFWLKEKNGREEERIFTIDNNKKILW